MRMCAVAFTRVSFSKDGVGGSVLVSGGSWIMGFAVQAVTRRMEEANRMRWVMLRCGLRHSTLFEIMLGMVL